MSTLKALFFTILAVIVTIALIASSYIIYLLMLGVLVIALFFISRFVIRMFNG